MNLDDLIIETTEVKIGKKEFEQRQVRLIAALLAIDRFLRAKETSLGFSEVNNNAINNQQKEAA